ncbi:MAG: GlmU family protein [Bacteroidales bacterium]|nr:GlmU family protein [Bacteroidales bacterium]
MNYILFDTNKDFKNFLPLTYTRPVSEIRIGILTIKEKWELHFKSKFSYYTKNYLANKFPVNVHRENLMINSSVLPDKNLVEALSNLQTNSFLIKDDLIIAVNLFEDDVNNFEKVNFLKLNGVTYDKEISKLTYLWDIFSKNGHEIENDFKILTKNKFSEDISPTNTVSNEKNIFIEQGAKVECSVLNANDGYIYIGKDAVIMENSVVRGSLALCRGAQLNVRTTIYGPTTIGPYSKVGGEINNSVFIGFSNKAHDGFLGNSVIGEWCNLGAGTNNSNLKNNYEQVRLWNYRDGGFTKTGLQFCGLVMADHSKAAINTMFNTGTVIGVSSNIYGSNFPRNFIPSYSWGGAAGFTEYNFDKAIKTAQIVMGRRGLELTEFDKNILQHVFNESKQYRKTDK